MDEERRRFCQYAGLVILGTALPSCGSGSSPVDGGQLACGPVSAGAGLNIADLVLNSATPVMINAEPIFICRDAKGVYALNARCTHVGTNVNLKNAQDATQGFQCPLHFATYDFNGDHATAPAPSPLKHYLVCTTLSGTVVVDTEQEVASNVRFRV